MAMSDWPNNTAQRERRETRYQNELHDPTTHPPFVKPFHLRKHSHTQAHTVQYMDYCTASSDPTNTAAPNHQHTNWNNMQGNGAEQQKEVIQMERWGREKQ